VLKTVYVPKDKNITLSLPESFVGTKVEILVFPLKEAVSFQPDVSSSAQNDRGYGCMEGKIRMSDDFDAPLEDFKEYM